MNYSDEKIIVRQAQPEDSVAIWEIRNHPDNREYFNQTEAIDLDSHRLWFNKQYAEQNNNFCLVLLLDQAVVGYCRFDLAENNCHMVSIALHPKVQSRGLGHELLNRSTIEMSRGKELKAKVKKSNQASAKLFLKNNYLITSQDQDYYYFRYEKK